MAANGMVPDDFGCKFTVMIQKNYDSVIYKCMHVEDFSWHFNKPVISKVFEYCILDRYR